MKGDKADYVFNLKKAKMFTKDKRTRKALVALKGEVYKHTRNKNILISNEVNEFIHKNSKNIPERIPVTLKKIDEEMFVYLQGGTQLDIDEKKFAQQKKEKQEQEKKEKKEEKKEEQKEPSKEETKKEEDKEKLEDKRVKEKASKAIEMKRKSGKM